MPAVTHLPWFSCCHGLAAARTEKVWIASKVLSCGGSQGLHPAFLHTHGAQFSVFVRTSSLPQGRQGQAMRERWQA